MSDMKCPFCGTILDKAFINDKIRGCPKCRNMGNIELWQELIRTRKALEIAVKRLGYIKNNYKSWTPDRDEQMIAQAVNGLAEIKTALEQKDE